MRSMWKGSISFGLVNIPVSLYKATEDHKTSFRTLHEECKSPIQYKKWCPVCNRDVEQKETVRGFEFTPSNFVLITNDDINNLPLPTLRTIEILHFTNKDNIDPLYYENAYYLGPREYGGKPYKLLYEAMNQTDKVAVAKVAFRTSEHLSVLRLHKNCLVMNIIHYPAEIRSVSGVPGLEGALGAEVSEAELQVAEKLIMEISGDFRDDYQSNYEAALQSLLEVKVQNKEVTQPETIPQADNVVNLMEALQKSLSESQEKHSVDQSNPTTSSTASNTDSSKTSFTQPKGRRRKI